MKVKLDHIGILVENLDKEIIEFYQQVFGCELEKYFQVKNDDEEINYVHVPFPKGDVELLAPVRDPSKDYIKRMGREHCLNCAKWRT